MDQEIEDSAVIAKRLALLAQTLEQRVETAIAQQQQAIRAMEATSQRIHQDIGQVLQQAGTQMTHAMRQGVDTALSQSTQQYQALASATASQLTRSGAEIVEIQRLAGQQISRILWTAYAAIGGAMLLLLLGGAGLIYFQWQHYRDAQQRIAQLQSRAEVIEALARAHVTSCGGQPCIKLDKDSPHWGTHGEYILVEVAPAAD
ncbi:MAG: hypothetical protein LBL59_12105 [Xanthomonadaceae bacterium]|jgi:exonuclease VII large subunit|nr:hypothetical protein [Xanthomonadaceae bacterium]